MICTPLKTAPVHIGWFRWGSPCLRFLLLLCLLFWGLLAGLRHRHRLRSLFSLLWSLFSLLRSLLQSCLKLRNTEETRVVLDYDWADLQPPFPSLPFPLPLETQGPSLLLPLRVPLHPHQPFSKPAHRIRRDIIDATDVEGMPLCNQQRDGCSMMFACVHRSRSETWTC